MIVRENIEFQRGKDPKDSIGIGDRIERSREPIRSSLEDLARKYGGRVTVRKLSEDRIKGLWTPGPEKFKWEGNNRFYNYHIEAFIANDGKLWFSPGVSKSGTNEWLEDVGAAPTAEEAKEKIEEIFLSSDSRNVKIIDESYNFQRGKDPKETMGVGLEAEMEEKYGKLWKVFKRCNDLSHISENFEWVSEIQFNEKDPYFNIESYFYYTDDEGAKYPLSFVAILYPDEIYVKEVIGKAASGIRTVRQFVDFTEAFTYDEQWEGLFESVNFERGKDPRDQMEIGINRQFQKAIEELLLRDEEESFAINSIAFPRYSNTIDFVVDDWQDDIEDTLEKTKDYIMGLASENEEFDIFDFIDSGKWTGGGYKNGVFKFVAPIDPKVTRGLKGKMILAENQDKIKIMDL